MATCESCGAQVIFCFTAKGKKMPLDPVPSPKGNQVVVDEQVRPATAEDRRLLLPLFISHFATCTEPGKWRRR